MSAAEGKALGMSRVLIKDGYVVTVDLERSVHPGGFVLINGSKIESVGGPAQVPKEAVELSEPQPAAKPEPPRLAASH